MIDILSCRSLTKGPDNSATKPPDCASPTVGSAAGAIPAQTRPRPAMAAIVTDFKRRGIIRRLLVPSRDRGKRRPPVVPSPNIVRRHSSIAREQIWQQVFAQPRQVG